MARFELVEHGHTLYADYRRDDDVLQIKYVFAPEASRGTGAAGRLMDEVARAARTEGRKILPICGYAAAWLRKHKEYHDLLV
ncbi:MAG: GNAT family N-acetyltransferase [Micavibrio sp.]